MPERRRDHRGVRCRPRARPRGGAAQHGNVDDHGAKGGGGHAQRRRSGPRRLSHGQWRRGRIRADHAGRHLGGGRATIGRAGGRAAHGTQALVVAAGGRELPVRARRAGHARRRAGRRDGAGEDRTGGDLPGADHEAPHGARRRQSAARRRVPGERALELGARAGALLPCTGRPGLPRAQPRDHKEHRAGDESEPSKCTDGLRRAPHDVQHLRVDLDGGQGRPWMAQEVQLGCGCHGRGAHAEGLDEPALSEPVQGCHARCHEPPHALRHATAK
mmetsp:Transcript_3175/g.12895  ORF Transcript_3175/g.12895 Transcript_3175/m.12895 type:complete len:274 (+) Transcript_3175:595-1416(+)